LDRPRTAMAQATAAGTAKIDGKQSAATPVCPSTFV
jgi:hypothetical protein